MDLVIPNVKSILNLALTQVLGDSTKAQKILNTIGQCQNGSCQASLGYTTPIESIEQSLEALNLGSVDAQKFMLNGMTEKLKRTGLAAGFKHYRDINTANMLYQSIQQRNLQWASEGNIFLNAMRPMMAFIEGFFYAISPFAAIIILLGLFGLNIFFKYIMLLLWIQLWTPIMSIANLFIITSAKQALNPLTLTDTTAEDGGAISTYYYETIVQVCQDKIAVGSMMLAATPVLSLMIISGSIYAFTSLTNRIAGADHFNEKTLAPDVVSPAPIMTMKQMFNGNQFGFSNESKAQNQFNIGEGLSLEKSNTFSSMNSISNSLGSTMEKLYAENGTMTDGNSRAGAWNEMMSNGNAKDLTKTAQNIMSYARQKGMNIKESEIGGVALAVAGGKGVVGGMSASKGYSQDQIDLANAIVNNSDSISTSTRAQTTSSVSSSYSDTFKNDDSYSKVGTSREGVSEQASKLRTLSTSYQEVEKYSSHYGSDTKYSEFDIISNVIGSKDELYYNGKFKEFTEQNLTSEEKKGC